MSYPEANEEWFEVSVSNKIYIRLRKKYITRELFRLIVKSLEEKVFDDVFKEEGCDE